MITTFVILCTVPFLALSVAFYLIAAPRLDAMEEKQKTKASTESPR